MEDESVIVRLTKAILESDSYEEFTLKCATDGEVAAVLEYMAGRPAYPVSPLEVYVSIKDGRA